MVGSVKMTTDLHEYRPQADDDASWEGESEDYSDEVQMCAWKLGLRAAFINPSMHCISGFVDSQTTRSIPAFLEHTLEVV